MTVRVRDVVITHASTSNVVKAVAASVWKSGFIRDTFVRDRRTFDRYQRSVMGDLAKLAVKSWLEGQGLEVDDWDDMRSSWRSQRKTYDLQVNGHNIEVRSSIAGQPSIRWVLNQESIIHPCSVRVKEITVQAFFRDNSYDVIWLCGWAYDCDLADPSLRSPRRVGHRLVDFFLMPFGHPLAHPVRNLPPTL